MKKLKFNKKHVPMDCMCDVCPNINVCPNICHRDAMGQKVKELSEKLKDLVAEKIDIGDRLIDIGDRSSDRLKGV